ncbi:MAG: DNA alkylation repair protein [Enterococcus sp.]
MERIVFPKNPELAAPMAAYMKHHFIFAGVKKPERALLTKELLKDSKNWSFQTLQSEIFWYYNQEEREYHYLAIELFVKNVKKMTIDELASFLSLVAQHQWWDSVDSWRKGFGDWVKNHPEQLTVVYAWFYQHEDFWFRRLSIILQLQQKVATDTQLLKQAILFDQETPEFFIQKAIGWSLREYSKTNPEWVSDFLVHHQLSKLAVREASKYL